MISNSIKNLKKLFIVSIPIPVSFNLHYKDVASYIAEIESQYPSKDTVFEGKYNYEFISIPTFGATSLSIKCLSDIKPEDLESIKEKITKNGKVGEYEPHEIPTKRNNFIIY